MQEDKIATGISTALKSGNCLHIVLPKQVVDLLGIQDRDKLSITVSRIINPETGKAEQKPVKRHDLKKHLVPFPKKKLSVEQPKDAKPQLEAVTIENKGEPTEAEKEFLQRYEESSRNPLILMRAEKQFTKERVAKLLQVDGSG